MKKWFLKRRVCRKLQAGICSLVVLSLSLAPISAEATQSGSQSASGNTNKMASMLSSAIGVLSMASGALTMAKGAQQMSCCMQGCDGAGKEGTAKKKAQDETANQASKVVENKAKTDLSVDANGEIANPTPNFGRTTEEKGSATKPANRSEPELQWRFPDSASLDPSRFGPSAQLGMLIKLFRAPAVNASGCIDAALALATGGLMLLQGMQAMMSAKQAAANADSAYNNAGGLGTYDPLTGGYNSGLGGLGSTGASGSGLGGTSGSGDSAAGGGSGSGSTPESTLSGTQIGSGGNNPSAIRIDPALLRNGKAASVMGDFEKQFGIDRDQFAKDVAAGKDPRELLTNAPKNPISVADMNKGTSAARSMSDSEKEAALANSGLGDIQKEIAANASFGLEDSAYNANGKAPSSSSASRKLASELDSLDSLPDLAKDDDSKTVSPEIKEALAKREEELAKKSHFDTSLFEVVHRKYVEKSKMISGAGVRAVGVVHAVEE